MASELARFRDGKGLGLYNDAIPTGPGGQQNSVFRAERYGPGLAGRDLTGGSPIEAP